MAIDEGIGRVKNPLTMVAVFAAISEVAMAVVITRLPTDLQQIFIWFVMGFPTLLVLIFFFVLYKKPAVFFSPGDYKREELYVNSIGLSRVDESLDLRVKKTEETLMLVQDFLEETKLKSEAQIEFSEVRKSIQRQQELEVNPLYKFITKELQVDHELARELVLLAGSARELPKLLVEKLGDRRKSIRLLGLIESFIESETDFQKLKISLSEGEAKK